jgi:ADP-ribose pyrophosphatase YjhB (NUDIX family)
MGGGCLFFNEEGDILLVRPTYKPGWEIPGGVVELDESPKQCCMREVQEELGLKRNIGDLLVVDYNRDTQEKTESLMFIFNGGLLTDSEIRSIQLRQEELSEFRFFSVTNLPTEMTPDLRDRVLVACQQADTLSGVYLEDQKLV